MNIKRYNPEACEGGGDIWVEMSSEDNGDFVLYSDYELRGFDRDLWKKELKESNKRNEALEETLTNSDFLLEHARIRCKEEIARVKELEAVLRNYHRSNCGMSKDCGHEFFCTCPSDAVVEALKEK